MSNDRTKPAVVVTRDGPYLVSGDVPLEMAVITPNAEGASWDWVAGPSFPREAKYALCRCGRSLHEPFCDGTHVTPHFNGSETATRAPFAAQATTHDGSTLTLSDAPVLCANARFCEAGGRIWSLIEQSNNAVVSALVIRQANQCPSGRLVIQDRHTRVVEETPLIPSIGVVEDPALGVSGPLWVRGGIHITSAEGVSYERRNRVALCRCGASSNKPFCDGSHVTVGFQDGLTPDAPSRSTGQ